MTVPLFSMASAGHLLAINQAEKPAWLLQYTLNEYIALPYFACQEVIEQPVVIPIPGMRDYGYGLMQWHRQWIPLIDFTCLLKTQALSNVSPEYALITAYQTPQGKMAYGALAVSWLPELIYVSDEAFCGLPIDNTNWATFAVSCFWYQQNQPVPIIDTSRVFNYHVA